MASAAELQDSLESFAESCNANERLRVMNRDWNRTIHVHASDLGCDFTLQSVSGAVSVQSGTAAEVSMAIRATSDVLTEIFYGELSPNEPYNDGRLRVQGSENDILHLDFITAMLWG